MKKVLLVLLIMASSILVSQEKKKTSHKNLTEINNELAKRIDSLQNQHVLLIKAFKNISKKITSEKEFNDSLKKELANYKIKEGYYLSNLSLQTAWFTFIVSLFIFLAGIISWKVYKKETNDHIEETKKILSNQKNETEILLSNQKNEFDKKLEKVKKLEYELFLNLGNLCVVIANYTQDKKQFHTSMQYFFKAFYYNLISDFKTAEISEAKGNHDIAINNLESSLKNLKYIIDKQLFKEEIKKKSESLFEFIYLIETDFEINNNKKTITNLMIEFKYLINKYTKS